MKQENKEHKLLEVRDLQVSFFTPAGEVKAVNGISYDVNYNEVMGIVGESGSGKSVEAYSVIGLLQNTGKVVGGSITFEGQDMLTKRDGRIQRKRSCYDFPESYDLSQSGIYNRKSACRGVESTR